MGCPDGKVSVRVASCGIADGRGTVVEIVGAGVGLRFGTGVGNLVLTGVAFWYSPLVLEDVAVICILGLEVQEDMPMKSINGIRKVHILPLCTCEEVF